MNALLGLWLPLLVAYAPTLWWCVERWNAPTQYFAHCWLVPPLAAWLLWQRRADWQQRPAAVDRRGLWLLLPGLLLHLAGALLMVDSWSAASLVLTVPGAAWFALGRARLRGQWPVLLLVLFVVPAPMFVEGRLAFLLKEVAVHGGSWLGNLLGADVVRRGDHLQPNGLHGALYVADACSGLRSLLAMLTMAYCLAFFTGAPRSGRRVALLLAAPLLAVLANTLRIAALCLMARWAGVPFAEGTGHTLANVAEWASLLLLLLGLDALLSRRARAATSHAATPAAAAAVVAVDGAPLRARRTAAWSWPAAILLAWLCVYRPLPTRTERAASLPDQVAGFTLVPRSAAEEAKFQQNLPRWRELLGTGDFVWRRYREADGGRVHIVALFHDANWKSVHPPRICIEGSNMDIEQDDLVRTWADGPIASRIVARSRDDGWRYVTLSVFGTAGWAHGDYWRFTLHHMPRALLRQNESGFLLRAEAPIRPGESDAAAASRAGRFLRAMLPIAQERVR
ncbi:MAG: exosortase/archaeosortase family protein [Planctomycetota bacterium]